ncbi:MULTISPECIES: VOC family protein [Novosphingobium]|nr:MULTISPECIES: VOC family protein [Novosphingobium]
MVKQLAHFGMAVTLALTCQGHAMAEQAGHVTGVGGVFIKSNDPQALINWYREVLGLDVQSWGGAALAFDAPGHPPKVSWTPLPESSDYMAPSKREFMINFAVDDMDAIVARLTAHGVPILKRDDDDAFGRFAWIQDPDGTKIELWEPKRS